jgi:hypothetical protein
LIKEERAEERLDKSDRTFLNEPSVRETVIDEFSSPGPHYGSRDFLSVR